MGFSIIFYIWVLNLYTLCISLLKRSITSTCTGPPPRGTGLVGHGEPALLRAVEEGEQHVQRLVAPDARLDGRSGPVCAGGGGRMD